MSGDYDQGDLKHLVIRPHVPSASRSEWSEWMRSMRGEGDDPVDDEDE